MNIEKVNAVLGKALSRIQEGEAQGLRDMLFSEEYEFDDDSTALEAVVDQLANRLAIECQVDDDSAISGIVEVAGVMADEGILPDIFGLSNPTEEDVDTWINAVENSDLVAETVRYLSS